MKFKQKHYTSILDNNREYLVSLNEADDLKCRRTDILNYRVYFPTFINTGINILKFEKSDYRTKEQYTNYGVSAFEVKNIN